MTSLQFSSFYLWIKLQIMAARRRAHSLASSPLWVVLLWRPENSMAYAKLALKQIGTGASLIRDPFPLLKRLPSMAYPTCYLVNSLIDMEMFPPSPIEWGRPPLPSPCSNHMWNMYRVWTGSNLNP